MARVERYARRIGAGVYSTSILSKTATSTGTLLRTIGVSDKKIDLIYKILNWLWIQQQEAIGRKIIDIGRPRNSNKLHQFYELESRAVDEYFNLIIIRAN